MFKCFKNIWRCVQLNYTSLLFDLGLEWDYIICQKKVSLHDVIGVFDDKKCVTSTERKKSKNILAFVYAFYFLKKGSPKKKEIRHEFTLQMVLRRIEPWKWMRFIFERISTRAKLKMLIVILSCAKADLNLVIIILLLVQIISHFAIIWKFFEWMWIQCW